YFIFAAKFCPSHYITLLLFFTHSPTPPLSSSLPNQAVAVVSIKFLEKLLTATAPFRRSQDLEWFVETC
ncbi:hypothetical protein CFP56_028724, partial [Quercus suber]